MTSDHTHRFLEPFELGDEEHSKRVSLILVDEAQNDLLEAL